MRKLTIYLTDLRHNYLGYVSSDAMPLGIGYMKSVMVSKFPHFDVQLFAYPDQLEKKITNKPPDILMLTNYIWNEKLSLHFAKQIKKTHSKTLVVLGGPNIPIEKNRRKEYLEKNDFIDIYALGEGDFYATEIVQLFIDSKFDIKRLLTNQIHSSIYNNGEEIIVSDIIPRSKNLDEIPSPWLSGIMDQFFDGMLVPLFETNRGCPFSCSFCVQGSKWYSKVHHFSLERIEEEINYIAKKISTDFPQQKMIRIADPNFGMFARDIEIAKYLGSVQKKYNYPLLIDATTGKNRADNIIKTMEEVNGALIFYQAVQSLDDEVLENIQRANIKLESYKDLQIHVKGRGLKSSSDLILGLPGESLLKHLKSLEKLINSGTDKLNNFQAMLLKGSEMESLETRNKFGFHTKYRMLPKAYGKYFGEIVIDNEEIIVANKDLPFEHYLTARKYHLVINVFWNFTRFEGFINVIMNLGFTPWDWIERIVSTLINNENLIEPLLNEYILETKNELFDNESEVISHYSTPDNLAKLNSGIIGDNLIYKYRTLALFYFWDGVVKTALETTREMVSEKLNDIELDKFLIQYSDFVLNLYAHGKSKEEIIASKFSYFDYDFIVWKNEGYPIFEIAKYRKNNRLVFELSNDNLANLNDSFKIWSFDPKSFSMFIRRIHQDWLVKSVKEY